MMSTEYVHWIALDVVQEQSEPKRWNRSGILLPVAFKLVVKILIPQLKLSQSYTERTAGVVLRKNKVQALMRSSATNMVNLLILC